MSLPPRVRRSVTVLGVTAGLVGAFAAGTAVTGGDDPGRRRPRPRPRGGTDASPVAFTGSDLALAESCDELLDWYVARGVDRVGPYGWDYGYGCGDVVMADGAAAMPSAAGAAGGSSVTEQRSTSKAPARWPPPPGSRTTTAAPTSRSSASTSPTWSRPTAARCSGSRATTS